MNSVEESSSPEVQYTTHSLGGPGFGNPNYCRAILPQSKYSIIEAGPVVNMYMHGTCMCAVNVHVCCGDKEYCVQ